MNLLEARGFVGEIEFWVCDDFEVISPEMNRLCLRIEARAVSDGGKGTLVAELLLFLRRQVMELLRLLHHLLHQALGDSVVRDLPRI